jgi:hypothetical protein
VNSFVTSVCGEITFASRKHALTPLIKWMYFQYFGCTVGDQGKSCFFRQLTGLSIRNLSLQVRPSMWRYIVMYWGGEGGHEAEAARQSARVQWGAPSWQCTSTHRFSCAVVFGLQKHDCHPPQLPDLVPCDFFCLPKDETEVEGVKIWHSKGYPGRIAVGAEDAGTKGL